jgi:hypothetical protein
MSCMEADEEARRVWEKIPEHRKQVILDPSKYVGDCVNRTISICNTVEQALNSPWFLKRLERPPEASVLMLG